VHSIDSSSLYSDRSRNPFPIHNGIFKMISMWLHNTCLFFDQFLQVIVLTSVGLLLIYFHRIPDNQMAGTLYRRISRALAGRTSTTSFLRRNREHELLSRTVTQDPIGKPWSATFPLSDVFYLNNVRNKLRGSIAHSGWTQANAWLSRHTTNDSEKMKTNDVKATNTIETALWVRCALYSVHLLLPQQCF